MDRRKSIKSLLLGGVATGLAVHGCKPKDDVNINNVERLDEFKYNYGRTPKEKQQIEALEAKQFFNTHEMETLAVLCDLILPANDKFGSATDAKVPAFIEFMAKDFPDMKVTLRGGLMWLDHTANTKFGSEFKILNESQQKQILDTIAFINTKVHISKQPLEIQFFALIRNLTLTGYYTTKMGIEDLGYKGNQPNVWDGVPDDVLAQHGVAYDEDWLAKCIDQSKRNITAEWDDKGNLLT